MGLSATSKASFFALVAESAEHYLPLKQTLRCPFERVGPQEGGSPRMLAVPATMSRRRRNQRLYKTLRRSEAGGVEEEILRRNDGKKTAARYLWRSIGTSRWKESAGVGRDFGVGTRPRRLESIVVRARGRGAIGVC